MTPRAESATLYWSGGDGTWDTSELDWTLDSGLLPPFQVWDNATIDDAIFSSAGNISLAAPIITAGALSMATGSLTVGTGTTLNTASATLGASGTTGSVTVDGANAIWNITNTSGTIFSIPSGGSASLTISNGGALNLASTGTFASALGQTGTFLLKDAGSSFTSTSGTFRFGGAGTTTATIQGGAAMSLASGLNIGTGTTAGAVTDVIVTGTGTTMNTGAGGITLSGGTNSLTISNGASVTTGSAVSIGSSSLSVSTVTVGNGGTLTAGAAAVSVVGETGMGTLNLLPGSVTTTGLNLRLGNNAASKGVVNQTGGTITIGGALDFNLGNPEYHLLGGTLIVNDTSGFGINAGSPTTYLFELGGGTLQPGGYLLTTTAKVSLKTGTMSTLSTPTAGQYLSMSGVISGAGGFEKTGLGTLGLEVNNTYTGQTKISGGVVRVSTSTGIPVASTIVFNGGMLEFATAPFNLVSGTSARPVQWLGDGGFQSGSAARTVLYASNAALTWGNSNFVPDGSRLLLGSSPLLAGSGALTFSNAINFGTSARTVDVADGLSAVDAILSGTLTGTGAGGIVKTGGGVLSLTGTNTYAGATDIRGGALRVTPAGLSPNSNIVLNGGVIEFTANPTLVFGTGAGQLRWTGSGGFSASGATITVGYAGGGALTWGASNFVPDGSSLLLSSLASNNTVILPNAIDFGGAVRTVMVSNGSAAIDATLGGVLINGGLIKSGDGTLSLTGANTFAGGTTITGGALNFISGSLGSGVITINGGELQWATGNTEDVTTGGRLNPLGLNGATFNTLTNNVTLAGTITGPGAFTKSGTGILTLAGTNTYTGLNTINAGLVNFTSAANFGTNTITLNGGGLQWATGTTTDISPRLTAIGSSGGTFDTNGNDVTLATGLTGTGAVTKSGLGTLKVTGANPYTGSTIVAGGTLTVRGSGTSIGLGASAGSATVGSVGNATLSIENGGSVKNTTATLGASGTTGTVNVDGAGSLWNITSTSGNTLSIASGANGVLSVTNGGAVTTVRPAIFSPIAARTMNFLVDGPNSAFTSAGLTLGGGGTLLATISNGGTVTSTGTSFLLGNSGSSTLTVGGNSATLNVPNASIVIGNTNGSTGILNVNAGGIVNAGNTIRLGNADPSIATVNQNGGTVTVARYMEFYVGVLEYHLLGGTYIGQDYNTTSGISLFSPNSYLFELGGGTLQAGTGNLTVNADATLKDGTTSIVSTPLSINQYVYWGGVLSGSGTLKKTDQGILILSQANTYTGGTILEQGILNPAVSGSLGTGPLTITGNATVQLPNSQSATVTLSTPITINTGVTATMSVQNRTLTLTGSITGDGSLIKSGGSLLVLSGNNSYTGPTTISAGILRAASATALSPSSNLRLNGGVIEVGSGASTAFNYGTGGGQLQWIGSGGFSVSGANRTINYEGGADLTWAAANFVPDGSALILSSGASDATTDFPNNIDLAGVARTVQVNDGLGAIDATLSGIISNGSLIKTGTGALLLSGSNTYTGSTTISGGMLVLSGGVPAGNLALDGGVLGTSGTYNPTLGPDPGQVQITGNGGGFAAVGGALNVGSLTGTWGTTTGFGAGPLVLNSTASVDAVTLTGDFSLGTAMRTITVADNAASSADFAAISGNISSGVGGGLTKNGAGKLVLSGANTYSGGTTVSAGTLRASAGSIGSGRLSLAGGDLELVGDSDAAPGNAITISSDANTTTSITLDRATPGAGTTFTLGAATLGTGVVDTTQLIHLAPGSNVTSGTAALVLGNATLNSDIEFSPAAGASITIGSISGTDTWIYTSGAGDVNITGVIATTTGRIGVSGPGKLTVSGNNTFNNNGSYSAYLSSGTLRATTSVNALGTGTGKLMLVDGTLELANDTGLNFARNTQMGDGSSPANTVTIKSDVLTNGAPGVTHTLGTLTINNFANPNLIIAKGDNVGSGTAGMTFGAVTLSVNGATFTTNAGALLTLGAVSGSGRSFTVAGVGDTTIGGAITTGSGTITKSGGGKLTLSGANTYTGITTVSGGTLQFAKANSLLAANWTASKLIVNSGATAAFNVGGTNEFTAANITTLKALGAASGGFKDGSFLGLDTTNATGGNFAYSTAIANPNGGANVLGLVKLGTGALTLSGANTYTGATTISAGKLVVDGSITSATTINSGGTLGGHGTVGTVTINSGGLISPGNSPGTMNTGAESWGGGAGYVWELNNASDAGGAKGVTYDWLNIAGTLDIAATSGSKFTIYVTTLTGSNVAGATPGFVYGTTYQWVIASGASVTNFSADKFAIDTSAFFSDSANLGGFTVTNVGNDIVLNLTYVPEPGQWGVMIGLALGGLALLRRRSQLSQK